MALPYDYETAKKLHAKNMLTDHQLHKFKMACGGVVGKYAKGGDVKEEPESIPAMVAGSNWKGGSIKGYDNGGDIAQPSFNADVNAEPTNTPTPAEEASASQAAAQKESDSAAAAKAVEFQKGVDAQTKLLHPESDIPKTTGASGDYSAAPQNVSNDSSSEQGSQSQAVPGSKPSPQTLQDYQGPLDPGFEMQKKGVMDSYEAGKQEASKRAGFLKESVAQQKSMQQEQMQDAQKEADFNNSQRVKIDQHIDNFANGKIDPNHYWNSKSTGSKVMSGIAMVLGAFGGAQGNRGVQVIQDAIARDIELQKNTINRQGEAAKAGNELMRTANEGFKDVSAAKQVAMATALNITKTQLMQAAAQVGGLQSKAAAEQAYGQLQIAEDQSKMGAIQTMAANTPATDWQIEHPEYAPPTVSEHIIPGVGWIRDVSKVKEILPQFQKINALESATKDMQGLMSKPLKSLDPDMKARLGAKANFLIGNIKDMFGTRLNAAELELMDDIVPHPEKLWSLDTASRSRFNAILDKVQQEKDALTKTYQILTPAAKKEDYFASIGVNKGPGKMISEPSRNPPSPFIKTKAH